MYLVISSPTHRGVSLFVSRTVASRRPFSPAVAAAALGPPFDVAASQRPDVAAPVICTATSSLHLSRRDLTHSAPRSLSPRSVRDARASPLSEKNFRHAAFEQSKVEGQRIPLCDVKIMVVNARFLYVASLFSPWQVWTQREHHETRFTDSPTLVLQRVSRTAEAGSRDVAGDIFLPRGPVVLQRQVRTLSLKTVELLVLFVENSLTFSRCSLKAAFNRESVRARMYSPHSPGSGLLGRSQ